MGQVAIWPESEQRNISEETERIPGRDKRSNSRGR